jgi:hypothetical protein
MMVKTFLDQHPRLQHYSYYDQTLPCAPNKRRPDFAWLLEDRLVVLEVDEHAHSLYNKECEVSRITEVHEQGQGRKLLVVRFNPQKRLLDKMASVVEDFITKSLGDDMLQVVFVGYKREYDVLQEIEQVAAKRRRV